MRVDLRALGQAIQQWAGTGSAFTAKAAATGGIVLAAAAILYVVWPEADETPVDAIVSRGPVFTPVTWKPSVATPASAAAAPSSPSDDGAAGRATDMRDPASVTRAVQRHLTRAGCYGGPINGRWTTRTQQGMAAFTESVNARLPVDGPDAVLLALLETHADVTCADSATDDIMKRRPQETASIAPRTESASEMQEPGIQERSSAERIAAVDETPPETASSAFADAAAAPAVAAAPAMRKTVKADRTHAKRKYRRAPSVSRSFRKLQRSVSRLFF